MSTQESWIEELERSQIVRTGLRALVSAGALVTLYFIAPLPRGAHATLVPHVAVAMALFTAVLTFEVRSILKSDQPMLRAAVAMATVIPLFLVSFSWIYLTMSQTNVAAFGTHLSRVSALYFAITVFSTVGFGDITAKTDPARLVVSLQMLADLAFIAVVVRIIFGAASRGQKRRESQTEA